LLALLAKVAEYQIYEQEHYIVNELDKHQNGTQQRDDITLIGIKM
jgi:serine phosphatase RsbU (regulator of sigma subunit)